MLKNKKKHFVKLYKDSVLSAKSDNVLSTSISDHLEQQFPLP